MLRVQGQPRARALAMRAEVDAALPQHPLPALRASVPPPAASPPPRAPRPLRPPRVARLPAQSLVEHPAVRPRHTSTDLFALTPLLKSTRFLDFSAPSLARPHLSHTTMPAYTRAQTHTPHRRPVPRCVGVHRKKKTRRPRAGRGRRGYRGYMLARRARGRLQRRRRVGAAEAAAAARASLTPLTAPVTPATPATSGAAGTPGTQGP